MDNQSARDPYLALNEHFRQQAGRVILPGHAPGRVLSTAPLRVRADGLDLDGEDLRVAFHLTDQWREQLCSAMGGDPPSSLPPLLKAGDEVLLIPSLDKQIYYIIDKFVEVAT